MQSACIYVDQAVELPPQVDEYVRYVLGIASWEDRVPIPNELGSQRRFLNLAETSWSQSRNSASKCALEGDWQCNLYQLVSTMAELSGGVLETNVSEKRELTMPPKDVLSGILILGYSMESTADSKAITT